MCFEVTLAQRRVSKHQGLRIEKITLKAPLYESGTQNSKKNGENLIFGVNFNLSPAMRIVTQ